MDNIIIKDGYSFKLKKPDVLNDFFILESDVKIDDFARKEYMIKSFEQMINRGFIEKYSISGTNHFFAIKNSFGAEDSVYDLLEEVREIFLYVSAKPLCSHCNTATKEVMYGITDVSQVLCESCIKGGKNNILDGVSGHTVLAMEDSLRAHSEYARIDRQHFESNSPQEEFKVNEMRLAMSGDRPESPGIIKKIGVFLSLLIPFIVAIFIKQPYLIIPLALGVIVYLKFHNEAGPSLYLLILFASVLVLVFANAFLYFQVESQATGMGIAEVFKSLTSSEEAKMSEFVKRLFSSAWVMLLGALVSLYPSDLLG